MSFIKSFYCICAAMSRYAVWCPAKVSGQNRSAYTTSNNFKVLNTFNLQICFTFHKTCGRPITYWRMSITQICSSFLSLISSISYVRAAFVVVWFYCAHCLWPFGCSLQTFLSVSIEFRFCIHRWLERRPIRQSGCRCGAKLKQQDKKK